MRWLLLRYSASTGIEKRMELRPAAITGSMLARSWSNMKAWGSYRGLEIGIKQGTFDPKLHSVSYSCASESIADIQYLPFT